MKKLETTAIKAREKKATPGPWRVEPLKGYTEDYILTDDPEFQTKPWGNFIGSTAYGAGQSKQNCSKDADFIAQAREDIPDLLSALELAEAELKASRESDIRLWAQIGWPENQKTIHESVIALKEQAKMAKGECDRLREDITRIVKGIPEMLVGGGTGENHLLVQENPALESIADELTDALAAKGE